MAVWSKIDEDAKKLGPHRPKADRQRGHWGQQLGPYRPTADKQ